MGQIAVRMHTAMSQRETAADARGEVRVIFATAMLATIAASSDLVMRRGESAHDLSSRTGHSPPVERRWKS
ncbi:hypothetical protein [Nannocystis punicea]|uniref:Uncharacterized protein n=1 Tax=Nannocystis punicea TaxID=2995304 RepID=A0ABY7H517_9BACT|nr:hypothetical protein [Nannocystis poenicansa]WAS94362.1 hypothetical protein O0S08_50220 [Nannocystis poenicansa]